MHNTAHILKPNKNYKRHSKHIRHISLSIYQITKKPKTLERVLTEGCSGVSGIFSRVV